ncbi:glycyl-radical enzyme activating protein [Acidobacteriota bacterium]
MTKGIIFDIKRYAIHDGAGIRTTLFFKGCPLRCHWCHNPEGIALLPELMISQNRCVDKCQICLPECPLNVITKKNGRIAVDLKKCNLCGCCIDACAYEALALAGKDITVSDLMEEVEKDRIFYDESGGGVTISGGEPFDQLPFLLEFLAELKKRDIRVMLDTSGYVSFDAMMKVSSYVHLFLYDLKMMDRAKHEEYTGAPNDIILDNLTNLAENGVPFEVRIPLIAGINDDENNIHATIEFLLSLKTRPRVSLLPYHRGGCEKYKRLGKEQYVKAFASPTEGQLAKIMTNFSDHGFSVKIGG